MIRASLSCLMSVRKSDEKLLIFAFLISPSKINFLEKLYQAFDTVFHHQKKFVKNTPLPTYFQLSSPCFIWWWNTASHAYSGRSRPSDKVSVWSKNKRGRGRGGGRPLPWIHHQLDIFRHDLKRRLQYKNIALHQVIPSHLVTWRLYSRKTTLWKGRSRRLWILKEHVPLLAAMVG